MMCTRLHWRCVHRCSGQCDVHVVSGKQGLRKHKAIRGAHSSWLAEAPLNWEPGRGF